MLFTNLIFYYSRPLKRRGVKSAFNLDLVLLRARLLWQQFPSSRHFTTNKEKTEKIPLYFLQQWMATSTYLLFIAHVRYVEHLKWWKSETKSLFTKKERERGKERGSRRQRELDITFVRDEGVKKIDKAKDKRQEVTMPGSRISH